MRKAVLSHEFLIGRESGDQVVHSRLPCERVDKFLLRSYDLLLKNLEYPNLHKLLRHMGHGDPEAYVFSTQVSRVRPGRRLAVGGGGMHGGGKIAADDRGSV